MPEHPWELSDRDFAVDEVQIGPAHATRLDLKRHLSRTRAWGQYLVGPEFLTDRVQAHREHRT